MLFNFTVRMWSTSTGLLWVIKGTCIKIMIAQKLSQTIFKAKMQ